MNVKTDNTIYNGPLSEGNIKAVSETVRERLFHDEQSQSTAKAVFSVFVELVTNVQMHSVPVCGHAAKDTGKPLGSLSIDRSGTAYIITTRNTVKRGMTGFIKSKIDHLNTLDSGQLRALRKEQMRRDNDNPDSKGAGLGLIEIARRRSKPIKYEFIPHDDDTVFIIICVEINRQNEAEEKT